MQSYSVLLTMPKRTLYARIAITLPPEDLVAADLLAERLDRSRSWVVAEAIRRYVASEAGPENAELGPSRRMQLFSDLALMPEQRVLEAEETLRLSELLFPSRATGPRAFKSYDDFLDWKQQRDTLR